MIATTTKSSISVKADRDCLGRDFLTLNSAVITVLVIVVPPFLASARSLRTCKNTGSKTVGWLVGSYDWLARIAAAMGGKDFTL
jgi:hypothetical protein